MKNLSKVLILFVVLVAACSEDDQKPTFNADLLEQYDWVLVKQGPSDGRVVAVIGMPFPYLNTSTPVLWFTGAKSGTYEQTKGPGTFVQGTWSAKGDKLIMSGKEMKIQKLSEKELVYITPDKFILSWRGNLK